MVIWLLCDYSWCFLFVNICFFHSSGKLPSQIQSEPYSDAPDFLLNSLSSCIIEVSVHELLYIFLICLLHIKGIFAESTRQIPWHNTVAELLTLCLSVSKPQSLCFTIKNRECNLKALAPGTGISHITDDGHNGYSHQMLLKNTPEKICCWVQEDPAMHLRETEHCRSARLPNCTALSWHWFNSSFSSEALLWAWKAHPYLPVCELLLHAECQGSFLPSAKGPLPWGPFPVSVEILAQATRLDSHNGQLSLLHPAPVKPSNLGDTSVISFRPQTELLGQNK